MAFPCNEAAADDVSSTARKEDSSGMAEFTGSRCQEQIMNIKAAVKVKSAL